MAKHTIGVAAKAAGVSVETIRFYERQQLLSDPVRSDSGYRLYSDSDIERLQFIRKAKTLGFTLEDIAELLQIQDGHGGQAQVRERARVRLEDIENRIKQLTVIRDALAQLEHQCTGCGPISSCPIIEGVKAISL